MGKALAIKNVNIQLSLKSDIIKFGNMANASNSEGMQAVSTATQKFLEATKSIDEVIQLSDKAIAQSKDLGVDSKYFEDLKSKAVSDKALYSKRMNAVSKL